MGKGGRFRGSKAAGREADHSPPSADAENAWSYILTSTISLHGVVLSYAQGQFYLYLCMSFVFLTIRYSGRL